MELATIGWMILAFISGVLFTFGLYFFGEQLRRLKERKEFEQQFREQ